MGKRAYRRRKNISMRVLKGNKKQRKTHTHPFTTNKKLWDKKHTYQKNY